MCDNPFQAYCEISGTLTSNFTCSASPIRKPILSYPGEFCMENSNCITGTCQSNTCLGLGPGLYCYTNSACDVGLYCGPGSYCTPQLGAGSACTSDFQCQNNLACNKTLFAPGTCLGYYSIPSGSAVGTCVDHLIEGISNLCQSGSCYLLNPGFDSAGICVPAYKDLYGYPSVCEVDAECMGYNGVNTTAGSCTCGMDMYGRAYCDALSGDPPGLAVQALWMQHVNAPGISNCHTQRRFDMFCLQQNLGPSALQSFLKNRDEFTHTARYQGNDYCTKAIFNNQFFDVSPANFGCQAYSCANTEGWQAGTCITFTEATNSFAINPCGSGSGNSFCNISASASNKWTNVTCESSPAVPARYPGDVCGSNSACLSGVCVRTICRGLSQNSPCGTSAQCDVGLFCSSVNYTFTCQPLIAAYGFGCGSDFECINTCGCMFTADGPPGVCVPYFSLAIGKAATCGKNGISYLCASGACYNPGSSLLGSCTTAPVSTGAIPVLCTTSNACTGKNSAGQQFLSTCTCGYNTQGNSYCSLFTGDPPGQEYLNNTLKVFLTSNAINSCHATRRFSEDCFNVVSLGLGINTNLWYAKMLNFTNYPYYVDNDQCVQSMFTSAFWEAQPPGPHPQPIPNPVPPEPIYVNAAAYLVGSLLVIIS